MGKSSTAPPELLNDLSWADLFNASPQNERLGASTHSGVVERPASRILPIEHTTNKVRLRQIGDVTPNKTAEPTTELFSNALAGKLSRLESRIRSYLALSKNWDGDGAEAIPIEAIHLCLNYLDEIKNECDGNVPTNIAPSPNGEVLFYWNNGASYIELNFDEDGDCTLCYTGPGTPMTVVESDSEKNFEISDSEIFSNLKRVLSEYF